MDPAGYLQHAARLHPSLISQHTPLLPPSLPSPLPAHLPPPLPPLQHGLLQTIHAWNPSPPLTHTRTHTGTMTPPAPPAASWRCWCSPCVSPTATTPTTRVAAPPPRTGAAPTAPCTTRRGRCTAPSCWWRISWCGKDGEGEGAGRGGRGSVCMWEGGVCVYVCVSKAARGGVGGQGQDVPGGRWGCASRYGLSRRRPQPPRCRATTPSDQPRPHFATFPTTYCSGASAGEARVVLLRHGECGTRVRVPYTRAAPVTLSGTTRPHGGPRVVFGPCTCLQLDCCPKGHVKHHVQPNSRARCRPPSPVL